MYKYIRSCSPYYYGDNTRYATWGRYLTISLKNFAKEKKND
tara:strand:+ start:1032 stop:1154 length:123 start_codon:yes stop_codon:yes gene_type:complete